MIPFSTEMVSTYGISYFTANIIFQANQLLAGILYYGEYALWNGLAEVDGRTSRFIKDSSLVLPICSIIAMGLSFYMYAWSNLIYLTIPSFQEGVGEKIFSKNLLKLF